MGAIPVLWISQNYPGVTYTLGLIGKNAYEEVLIHNKGSNDIASDLIAERFRKITADRILYPLLLVVSFYQNISLKSHAM